MSVRRHRTGQVMRIVTFRCPRCTRTLSTSQAEAEPPKGFPVPYCGDCLKAGELIVMTRRDYRSGPPDLIV